MAGLSGCRRRIGKTGLLGQLYEEHSRLGIGDFPLTSPIKGWWDRRGDTEIDLVALNEISKRLRLGSCNRSELALIKDLARFDGHVARAVQRETVQRERAAAALDRGTQRQRNRYFCFALGYAPQFPLVAAMARRPKK